MKLSSPWSFLWIRWKFINPCYRHINTCVLFLYNNIKIYFLLDGDFPLDPTKFSCVNFIVHFIDIFSSYIFINLLPRSFANSFSLEHYGYGSIFSTLRKARSESLHIFVDIWPHWNEVVPLILRRVWVLSY